MSWLENIQTDYIITTGDGRSYFPEWLNAVKQKEFNVAEFEFPELQGTLVSRKKSKGRRYNIEIYFQGDNHIETATEFDESSEDERFWTIQHPIYGQLFVQPISLNFDNKDQNVTKITGVVVETIINAPKTKIAPEDFVAYEAEFCITTISEAFVSITPQLKTSDVKLLKSNINLMYESAKGKIKDTTNAEEYFNLFNTAYNNLEDILRKPTEVINAINAFINAPIYFLDTSVNRMLLFQSQIELLVSSVKELLTPNEIRLYEYQYGLLITSFTQSAVINQDYDSRDQVYNSMDIMLNEHSKFVEFFDSLQSNNYNSTDSYIPDSTSMMRIGYVMNYTISNLINISVTAKQERFVYLEYDSNMVNLTHRFYGLDLLDANIEKFINDNKIGLNEYLLIPKGRKIIWFV